MKRICKLTTIIILLFCSVSAFADINRFSGSLLWKISGNGLEQTSYILGTHHLIELSFLENISGLENAIENTTQIAGELDMTEKQTLRTLVANYSLLPDSITYESLLSPEDYLKFDNKMAEMFGGATEYMKKIKPFMISMAYSVIIYKEVYTETNLDKLIPIDEYLQKIMIEKGKTVIGLETGEEQLAALLSDSLHIQAENLLCLMEISKEEIKKITIEIADSYRQKNLNKLYELSMNNPDDPCPMRQETIDAMNINRNNNWLKILPDIMAEKPTFIVVGALHISGEPGLLYQLDKMGYMVEPVK